jgi:F0F1-type ATP synthase assembly protein I
MTPGDEHRTTPGSMAGDWSASGDFLGAILAGLLLGLLGDRLLGTTPWLVVIGVVSGFAVGFWRMLVLSRKIEVEARRLERERWTPPAGDDWPDVWGTGSHESE